jgi:hypothetical protein
MYRRRRFWLACFVIAVSSGAFLGIVLTTQTSTTDLIVNGGFEDGMKGWEFGPPPLALEGVDVVQTISNTGLHSLRLMGPGVGYLQMVHQRSIYPEMRLSFYTLLNAIPGEIEPQALFHFYFLPTAPNGPTYYVDITVTPANSEDLLTVFEPNPGIDTGGIYLRFNREPFNRWIHVSVDLSRLLERYLPDFLNPQANRIMLESAEGGRVYFDDISLKSTDFGYLEFPYLVLHYLVYSTAARLIAQLLAYSVIVGAGVSLYHRWRGKRGSKRAGSFG